MSPMSYLKHPYLLLKKALYFLTKPREVSEDARRQEFVLNILLLGVVALSLTAFAQVLVDFITYGARYHGVPPFILLFVILILLGLYALSRIGYGRMVAYIFILGFTAIGLLVSYTWGILLPAGPLVLVLVIVMSGILIGTRFSFVITGLVAVAFIVLTYAETHQLTRPDSSWMMSTGDLSDASTYIFIWGIITLVSWLSNRELEQSLRRARASEAMLEKERNLLEERVEERTRELKQAQLEKMLQLNRFADFGRISSGFFHDIINPLTAVSLNLEQLSTKERSELLQHAITGIKHIENFAMAARKQVQGHNDLRIFSPSDETREVVAILENKARATHVKLVCELDDNIRLYGSPIKFHQLISNLVANAIDAYEDSPSINRVVTIAQVRRGVKFKLTVSDNGVGIQPEHVEQIFDPFFTTKPVDKGTGIGLLIVKRIVEENFYGSIKVDSTPQIGTTFTIKLPAPQ